MGLGSLMPMPARAILVACAFLLAPLAALADERDAAAQFALALRYEHAEGVPRDYARALQLYCDAAQQGNAAAALNIGWMFLNARGVARDTVVGTAWLRLAAKRGSTQASNLLELLVDVPEGETRGCPEPEKKSVRVSPPKAIASLVVKIGAEYEIDPNLLFAVIATESAFQADAVSSRQARGLMQLTDETARRFGVSNVFEPADNIRGGAKYLRWLLTYFDGDLSLTLAAYNAGENAVTRYGSIPPFAETRTYVEKVLSLYPAQRDQAAARQASKNRSPSVPALLHQ